MDAEQRNQKSGDEIPPEIIAVANFKPAARNPTALAYLVM
jgi:hypothetical protein